MRTMIKIELFKHSMIKKFMLHIIKTTQKKVLLPSLLRLIGEISVRSSTLETALSGRSKVRAPT